MTFSEPRVKFIFSDNTETTTGGILKDSLRFDFQLMRDLRSSSNVVHLSLAAEPVYVNGSLTLSGRILTDTEDIKAQVWDGDALLFTGYVSNNKDWTISNRGERPLDLMLEDVGVRKLKAPAVPRKTAFHDTVSGIVGRVAADAGVICSPDNPTINENVYTTVEPTVNADTFLADLLYEYGYVYTFDNEGRLCIEAINLDPETGVSKRLWASNGAQEYSPSDGLLRVRMGNALTMRRSISNYRSAQVCFPTVVERKGVQVYKASDVTVDAGRWWDGNLRTIAGEGYTDLVSKPVFSGTDYSEIQGAEGNSRYGNIPVTQWTPGITYIRLSALCSSHSWSPIPLGRCGGVFYLSDARGPVSTSFSIDKLPYGDNTARRELEFSIFPGKTPTRLVFSMSGLSYRLTVSAVTAVSCTTDNSVSPATIEAQDLERGKHLWAMSNLVPTCAPSLRAQDIIAQKDDTLDLNVMVNNTAKAQPFTYDIFGAVADVIATDVEENYVYASRNDSLGGASVGGAAVYRYDTSYVTSREVAEHLASILGRYHAWCGSTYTFFTTEDIPMGAVVEVRDNLFTGMSVKMCLIRKTWTAKTSGEIVFEYSGYAISDIGEVSISRDIRVEAPQEDKSPYEYAVENGYTGSQDEFYGTLVETTPECLGVTTTAPSATSWGKNPITGDTCVYAPTNTNVKVYVYGSGTWTEVTTVDSLTPTQWMGVIPAITRAGLNVKDMTSVAFTYMDAMYTQLALIEKLGVSEIAVKNPGSIHSSAYDAAGANATNERGFWLGSNGQAKFNNVTIEGAGSSFDSDVFRTSRPVAAFTISSINVPKNGTLSASELIKIKSNFVDGSPYYLLSGNVSIQDVSIPVGSYITFKTTGVDHVSLSAGTAPATVLGTTLAVSYYKPSTGRIGNAIIMSNAVFSRRIPGIEASCITKSSTDEFAVLGTEADPFEVHAHNIYFDRLFDENNDQMVMFVKNLYKSSNLESSTAEDWFKIYMTGNIYLELRFVPMYTDWATLTIPEMNSTNYIVLCSYGGDVKRNDSPSVGDKHTTYFRISHSAGHDNNMGLYYLVMGVLA